MEAEFAQLPGKRQTLSEINKKLKVAEEGNLREIVGIQSQLAAEKSLLSSLDRVAQVYRQGLLFSAAKRDAGELCRTVGELTGDGESKSVIDLLCGKIASVNDFVDRKQAELNTYLKDAAKELAALLARLKVNHGRMDGEIAVKLADLRAKGLAGNLGELQALLRQKASVTQGISLVEQRRANLDSLRAVRSGLMDELAGVRQQMTARRKEQLRVINANLTKTITDYTVIVRYEPTGIIDQFLRHVSEVMRGSYFADLQCRDLCRKLTPQELAVFVRGKDVAGLSVAAGITPEWAGEIQKRFSAWNNIFELQVLSKQPCPVIVVKTKGSPQREIPVIQLSDGQRHTILLTIAMLAESNLPLVIDQPEDDLDSGFIFSSIVATLRTIKERRQVILVTHNANIAVLGDSELLFPMKRVNDQGKAIARGSIDRAETKEAAQKILEGGEVAFKRRQAIYGY